MGSPAGNGQLATVATAALASMLLYRVWVDALEYMYHRERMRACVRVVHEGIGLVRHALEGGTLGELGDSVAAWWAEETPARRPPTSSSSRRRETRRDREPRPASSSASRARGPVGHDDSDRT